MSHDIRQIAEGGSGKGEDVDDGVRELVVLAVAVVAVRGQVAGQRSRECQERQHHEQQWAPWHHHIVEIDPGNKDHTIIYRDCYTVGRIMLKGNKQPSEGDDKRRNEEETVDNPRSLGE